MFCFRMSFLGNVPRLIAIDWDVSKKILCRTVPETMNLTILNRDTSLL